MARKKLKVKKANVKELLRKKLTVKKPTINDLFGNNDPLYFSEANILTNNDDVTLFLYDNYSFLSDNGIEHRIELFELNEMDIQMDFERDNSIEPMIDDNRAYFEDIGFLTLEKYNWFKENYPKCVFHKILKWFGKEVNTLVIVLLEKHGKPVAMVKTLN